MDKAVDEGPRKHFAKTAGVTLPLDTVDKTSSGCLANQKTVSAEKGKKVFEAVVNELVKHGNLLKKAKKEDLIHKSKI